MFEQIQRVSISISPKYKPRFARMYEVKKNLLKGVEPLKIRKDLDVGKVLEENILILGERVYEFWEENKVIFSTPKATFLNVWELNGFFEREEGTWLQKYPGVNLRAGEELGLDSVRTALACKLIDESYFVSKYKDYHEKVAEAINHLVNGESSEWNRIKDELDKNNIVVDLSGGFLRALDLSNTNLNNVKFIKTDFMRALFIKATLMNSCLYKAHLVGTDFSEANLKEVNLKEALLNGAIFTKANLEGANLETDELHGVDLTGANLKGARIKEVFKDKILRSEAENLEEIVWV